MRMRKSHVLIIFWRAFADVRALGACHWEIVIGSREDVGRPMGTLARDWICPLSLGESSSILPSSLIVLTVAP
jgi:hypothetical protein